MLQYTLVHLHCYNYEDDDNDGYTHNDNGDEQVEFWGVAELCGKFNESCRVKSLDLYIFYCNIYIEVDILMELLMVIYILRWIYWWYYEFTQFIQFQNENIFNILQIYTYAMCMHVKFTCYHLLKKIEFYHWTLIRNTPSRSSKAASTVASSTNARSTTLPR